MNAIVAQIIAATPTPTPMPAFAPSLKPDGVEADEIRVCSTVVNVVTDADFWLPMTDEEKDEVDECIADLGTELLCAACTSANCVVEAPGIV